MGRDAHFLPEMMKSRSEPLALLECARLGKVGKGCKGSGYGILAYDTATPFLEPL